MNSKSPNLETVDKFFHKIIPYIRGKSLIREVRDGPVLYVGDIHGYYENLLDAFHIAKKKHVQSVVLLGDYTDRGENQLKCLLKVLDAFARSEGYRETIFENYITEDLYPFDIIALRGNHENSEINRMYGFEEELLMRHYYTEFPDHLLDLIYGYLPLIAVTPWKTIALHGGIPKPRQDNDVLRLIEHLYEMRTPFEVNFSDPIRVDIMEDMNQILWNDPLTGMDASPPFFSSSIRGPRIYLYNRTALERFLHENHLKRLVRAHEATRGAYQILWDQQLVHIFSAYPYYGQIKTKSYFFEYEDGSGEIINEKGEILEKVEKIG